MILLKKITLRNFLSHKETEIDFSSEEKLLIDGNSGSGKSAIVEAIIWAFYGKARVENRFLVTRGETKGSVTLDIIDGDTIYNIMRSTTTKGGHSIEVLESGKHIDRAGVRDIQDWIENELLHASYLLFVNSIAYVQDNSDTFVKQTASKRKELLLEIIRANQYADLYKKASDKLTFELGEDIKGKSKTNTLKEMELKLSLIAKGLSDKTYKAQQVEKELILVVGQIESLKKTQEKWKARVGEMVTIETTRRLLVSAIEKIDKKTKENTESAVAFYKKKHELTAIELEIEAIGDIQKKIDTLKEKIEADNTRSMKMAYTMSMRVRPIDYASQITEIDKQIKPLKEESGKCPSGDDCPLGLPLRAQISFLEEEKIKRQGLAQEQEKTLVEQERAVSELSIPLVTEDEREAYKTYGELSKKKDSLIKDADIIKIILSGIDVDKLSSEVLALSLESDKLKEDLQELEAKIKNLETEDRCYPIEIEGEILRLNGQSSILSRDLVIAQGDIRTAQDATVELLGISEQLKKIESENESVVENIKALTALKESFGQKGIPAVVVDYMVPKLEENINAILSQLSDFRMRIDTQRKNSSGDGIVEGLFLTIYNESGEEFDFDSYSGGQKLKITVAISEALAGLQKVGFRIMDETFTALDEESTDEFVEVMEKLQAQFKQIICITHLRNVKDLFDKKITVTRTNGLSEIN